MHSYNIKDFPFSDCNNLGKEELVSWAKAKNLPVKSSWMLPQIVAHYGTWKNVDPSNPLATLRANVTTAWEVGLWKVSTILSRGSLIEYQNRKSGAPYSALVPLIMLGQRLANNIPYSAWSGPGLEHVLGPDLYAAVTYSEMPEISTNRLIELRQEGLLIRSGPKAGTLTNPVSAWRLNGLRGTEFSGAPRLFITMLTQTWIAHPSVRHPNMILDPKSWDSMPAPLITSDILVEEQPSKPEVENLTLPWLQ